MMTGHHVIALDAKRVLDDLAARSPSSHLIACSRTPLMIYRSMFLYAHNA
jgi:hypothetical protein